MRPRSPRAFTLIELLVVIAIIGILAALLLPVTLMTPAAGLEDMPARRHPAGCPISFADGHVEVLRLANPAAELLALQTAATVSR